MEEIWMNACRNLEISDDIARPWYERIRKKMVQGSGRFYHNWDELLLRKEDYLRDVSSNVLFAVFFQYYEFDGKRNCVEKNCEAFDDFCTEAGIKDAPMAKTVRKLLGDESIEPMPGTEAEANLLQDLDLLVLGSSSEEYKRYRELLRKEYSHLDDDSYKQMRLKVTEPGPSTSREARKQTSDTASPQKSKRKSPAKIFLKFKDDKHKHPSKRYIKQASGRSIHFGYSASQMVSRKILRTIKKKQNPNNSRSQIGTKSRPARTSSICDLTKTAKSKAGPKSTNDDGDDDDCVLIGSPPPEIILIDDETAADASNLENISSDANISNVSNVGNNSELLLKPYQPIGSASTLRGDYYKTLHSTPKLNLNANTNYPPRYQRTMPIIREKSPDTHPESANSLEPILTGNVMGERLRSQKRKSSHDDDTVIFVSEEVVKKPTPVLTSDFISLSTPTEKYPLTSQEPKRKRQRNEPNELFNSKEQKQLRQYNENAYNPNKDDTTTATKKRMVIVDGSNVAYHHALNKEFSVKGLKICLEYFEKLGHEVKAVVPQFRLQKLKSSDPAALEKLHEEGKIVFTPCKNLPGKSSSSYDDRFILQLAFELDAAIVSNDNYRDLIHENPAFKKIIENRVVGFSWCNDLFILPKDPYGKWGPTLNTILNRS